jgi:hypothetical protein
MVEHLAEIEMESSWYEAVVRIQGRKCACCGKPNKYHTILWPDMAGFVCHHCRVQLERISQMPDYLFRFVRMPVA